MPKKCMENDEATRKMILDAAYKIGVEQGVDKITARRISSEIGFSTGVIYYHFQNKQEIMDILKQNRDNDVYEEIKKRIYSGSTLRENCNRVLGYICELAASNLDVHNRIFSKQCNAASFANSFWMDLIHYGLDFAAARGEIPLKSIDETAYYLLSFFIGYNMLLLELCRQDKETVKKRTDRMLDMLMNGLPH